MADLHLNIGGTIYEITAIANEQQVGEANSAAQSILLALVYELRDQGILDAKPLEDRLRAAADAHPDDALYQKMFTNFADHLRLTESDPPPHLKVIVGGKDDQREV